MFKKKPVYTVGVIVFTLILLAELAVYFLVPTGGRGGMAELGGMGQNGYGMKPSGFGGEGFESFGEEELEPSDGMQKPEGMEPPEGMEEPGDRELPEGMEMPENGAFDPSGFFGRGQPSGLMGVIAILRSVFWPVAAVCVLGDAGCIFMLLRISRRKKQPVLQEAEE